MKWSEVKVAQLCPTLCNPMDYTVHGTLQARILEWVAFPFSRESSQPRDQTQVSSIVGGFFTSWTQGKPKNTGVGENESEVTRLCRLFATPRTAAQQDPPSMEFSTGVGSLSLTSGDLPNPGIEPGSPALQDDSLPTELSGKILVLQP